MTFAELFDKFLATTEDLRVALRKGWLQAGDREASCNFCGALAIYDRDALGYVCQHEPTCLMIKHAENVGDVNDGEE